MRPYFNSFDPAGRAAAIAEVRGDLGGYDDGRELATGAPIVVASAVKKP